MFWDATMTLSPLTSLRETFSILMLVTSVWLDVSKNAEKQVSCLRDSGGPSGQLKYIWYTRSILNFRDRQFCHCGNVEPPTEFIRGWDMCGTACPPTPMSPPPDLGIVEDCGTSLHTMVSFHKFETIRSFPFLRSTPHPTPIMRSGTAPLMVGQNLTSLVSSLSQRLEGEPFFLVIHLPSQRWDTWAQGSTVEKGRRWGENMTHVRCAGGYVTLCISF